MKLSRASRMSRTTLGLAVLAAITSQCAVADDSGWYAGANVGQSRVTIDNAQITSRLAGTGLATTSITNNNRDTGYKLFGGYQINKNFALEAGYFKLGQFGYTATTVPAGTLSGNIKLQGVNLDAVGILPITEQFSVFGRLGANYAEARDSFTSTGVVPVPVNPNPRWNEINYKFGAGLQYDFTKALGMRLEAERYHINDAVNTRGNVDLYSLGLIYRFDVEKPAPVRVVTSEPVVEAPAPQPEAVVPPPPVNRKVVFAADSSADSLFDFGKSVVKPSGKAAIDKFTTDLSGANYEVITVTGHTDRIGSHAYNMKLSQHRAEAVKAYIVESAGIPADKIEATGVDGANPVTQPGECKGKKVTKKLIACLAPDRRVEVEVAATRTSR